MRLAKAGILMAALFPITAVLAGIVALFNDIGAYSRGKPSMVGDIVEFAKGFAGSTTPNTGNRQSLEEFIGSGGTFRDVDKNGVTISNTYHIQSTADPREVAQEVGQTQQQQLNRAYSGLNRGGF